MLKKKKKLEQERIEYLEKMAKTLPMFRVDTGAPKPAEETIADAKHFSIKVKA